MAYSFYDATKIIKNDEIGMMKVEIIDEEVFFY